MKINHIELRKKTDMRKNEINILDRKSIRISYALRKSSSVPKEVMDLNTEEKHGRGRPAKTWRHLV